MYFKIKIISGFGIALAILAIVCVLAYQSLSRIRRYREWVNHTYVVREKLGTIQQDLAEAEDAQRGYIITGRAANLVPYADALTHLEQELRDVRALTADNPVQQRGLDRLETLVAIRLPELQDRIDVADRDGMDAAIQRVREGAGGTHTQQIRAQIAEMREEESRLLILRSNQVDLGSERAKWRIVEGGLLGIIFLCLAGGVVWKEIGRRALACLIHES
jgi:CHASE3 domain sensor protein